MLDRVAGPEAARDDSSGGAPEVAGEDTDSLRDLASGAPVVKALEDIFERAVSMRATDIHFEPRGRELMFVFGWTASCAPSRRRARSRRERS